MEIRETEGVGSDVPAGSEPEEIGQGGVGITGSSGQNGVDGGVGMVDAGAILGGEFREVVLFSLVSLLFPFSFSYPFSLSSSSYLSLLPHTLA